MLRESMSRLALALVVLSTAGCSLVLDFSDGAIPLDASPDAPYTQAQCDYKEPNNSLAEAATLTPGETGPAAICASDPEDHDFYRFTVPADTASVTVQINFTNRPSGDIDLKLHDAAGTLVAQSRGFLDGETIICPAASPACAMLTPGDYVMEVFPALAGAVNVYDIALTITPM